MYSGYLYYYYYLILCLFVFLFTQDGFVEFFPSPKTTRHFDPADSGLRFFVLMVGAVLLCSYIVL